MLERFSWIINHHQPRLGLIKFPLLGRHWRAGGGFGPRYLCDFGGLHPQGLCPCAKWTGWFETKCGIWGVHDGQDVEVSETLFFRRLHVPDPCETLKSGRGFVVVIQTCSSKNLKWIGESTEKKKVGTTEHVSKIKFEDVWDLENDCFWVSMWFVLGVMLVIGSANLPTQVYFTSFLGIFRSTCASNQGEDTSQVSCICMP